MRHISFLIILFTFSQFRIFAQTSDIIWSENWEGGIGNWFASNGVWEVGTPAAGPGGACSGQNCAGTILNGNYPVNSNTRLTSPISPVILLPTVSEGEKILLRFSHWFIFGSTATGSIQISVDGGAWNTVSNPAFNGNGSRWTQYIADLSAYAGSSIKIGFLFISGNYSGTTSGWYIDDIIIEKKYVLFNNPEDFELGIGDWYPDNAVWQVGSPTIVGPDSTHSGQNCAGSIIDGDYPANAYTHLISPEIELIPAQGEIPVLFFWHWFILGSTAQGNVEISVNNGQWQFIAGPFTGTSNIWTQYIVDLSAFADSTVRLGFLFSSGSYSGTTSGWYIDDIRIEGLQSTVVTNVENDLAVQWLEPETRPLCGTLKEQPVTIQLENKGMNAISNFEVGYSINSGQNYITEKVYQTIDPGSFLEYTFKRNADMAEADSFQCKAFVNIPYDINDTNNLASAVIHNDRLIVDIETTDTRCNEATGVAEIKSITGRVGPFVLYWTSGDIDMVAEKLASGTYFVTIANIQGCSWTKPVIINDEGAPDYSAASSSIKDISCYGKKDGSIYILPTGGIPPYTYRWSNGAVTQDISGLSKGQYDVIIKDSKGCAKTLNFSIREPEPLKVISTSMDADCGGLNGSAEVIVSGGTKPYAYSWSSGNTSSQVTNLAGGIYTVWITDMKGCIDSAKVSINEVNAPGIIITSVNPASCGTADGSINISTADNTSQYTYVWSNGSSMEDMQNVSSGYYNITVSLEGGSCSSVQTIEIPTKMPPPGIICMVSVDSITGGNFIVTEDPEEPAQIASYNIYQLSKTGEYQYMNNKDLSVITNTIIDAASDVDVTSYRYRMTSVDNCGNESEPGPFHETMHIVVTPDFNFSWAQIFWNSYKGVDYDFFKIYRYSNLKGLEIIDTVPKTKDTDFYTYTDKNPPLNDTVYYVILIELSEPCITTKKAESHNTIRSNGSRKLKFGGENIANPLSIRHFNIYPNPNRGSFMISIETLSNQDIILRIFDAQGRIIRNLQYNDIQGHHEELIEINGSKAGIYYLQLLTKDGMIIKSFVIE